MREGGGRGGREAGIGRSCTMVLEIGIFVMRQVFSNPPLLIVRGYTVSINRLGIGYINKIFSRNKKDGRHSPFCAFSFNFRSQPEILIPTREIIESAEIDAGTSHISLD